jgi:hypothetical protein
MVLQVLFQKSEQLLMLFCARNKPDLADGLQHGMVGVEDDILGEA